MLEIIVSGFIGVLIGIGIMCVLCGNADDEAFMDGYDLGFEHGKAESKKTILKNVEEHFNINKKENNNEEDN